MLEPLVVVYLGDESAGLDLVSGLDRRVQRPIRMVPTQLDRLSSVLTDDRIDCVVCGPAVSEGDLQQTVFDIADTHDDIPLFDASDGVAAVPTRVEIQQLDTEAGPTAQAAKILSYVLEAGSREELTLSRGPFSYLAVDSEWSIVDWEPALSDWTDCAPADAVGSSLWDVFEEWAGTEFERLCRRIQDSDDEGSTRLFHETSRKWLDVHAVGHRGGGVELYILDVTEFQNAGGKIEGTGARFEETLERMTDAFFALDNQERFVFLNSQAEFLLDVDAREVTGVRFWDAFPAAVSTTFYREFNQAMETQEPTSFEEYYRPLNSWFEVNAYPSSDGLSVFLRDITEQIELQEQLEQLHDVTRELVVAQSDQEIAAKTVDATEEVLGFEMVTVWRYDERTDRLDPLAWSESIDERVEAMEPLGRESEFIWEVYESGEPRLMGFVPITTMTSHHPVDVSSELLVRIGEYGVLGAYSDERDSFDEADIELFKLLSSTVESAFRRAERERQLARRNERLNDFASIVSHDLRNPLNVASAHTELARLRDEPADHLDKIDESLLRMEELIEDMLSRARGEQSLDTEQLSLAQSARESWESVESENATLHLDGNAAFTGDPDRVKQLFENLFRNSMEHSSTSSQTDSDTEEHSDTSVRVRVGPTEDGFYVADDGPGIPPDEREEIFDRGVSHAESGTGFGLAIVEHIVDEHDWNIRVRESSDGGARFDIENVHSLVR